MELTLGDIRNKYQMFLNISSKRLPIKLAYFISKNLLKLEYETKIIDDNRIKVAQTYAVTDSNGKPMIDDNNCYVIDESYLSELNKELNEYYKSTTNIDICKVNVSELDKLDNSRYDALTPAELMALDFMLEYKTETN